jgi:hypothetical protein
VIGFVPDLWGGKSLDLLARDVLPQVASV